MVRDYLVPVQILDFQLKLNVHVQYNMLTAIWPAPIA